MKLSVYAQKIGVRYETAWRWFKAGSIRGHQLPTGTIIITEDEPTTNISKATVYRYPHTNTTSEAGLFSTSP